MSIFDVSHKRVVVIGGSRGIGYELARAFSEAGARVTIVAEVEAVHQASMALSSTCGRPVEGILCDITNRSEVKRVISHFDKIDVLVNNAAIARRTPVDQTDADTSESFRQQLDVNVNGLYWVTMEAIRKMSEGGRIIFTGSLWSKTAGPAWSAYVASKHAVLGLVRTLAMELGPRGINVNAVCPHAVATEMNLQELPADTREELVSIMWLRRGLIPPAALAGTYLFLASDAASEITGQAIHVDRGASI